MKRINNKKNLYKSIILLVILAIGIGYAYLTSNLSISGQTEVVANTWNIHFENLNVKDGSVSASTPATIDSNNIDITYAITLNRPKEYYEFTVDVKNDGTLPGKVSISQISGLDTTSSKVIDYSITYTNGNPVNVGDILNAGAKKKIKVRVFYKDDISATDFPASNLNLTLTYTLQYVQSEEDESKIYDELVNLSTNNECITKYEGNVTDQVGQTTTASKVYFDKCEDKRNIIFNNMCWQIIRTTETGGIKMIYNGEVLEGKCEKTRGYHSGLTDSSASSISLDQEYVYGASYTYDMSNNTFTLLNTNSALFSESNFEELLGKYTCLSLSDTCNEIYYIDANSSTSFDILVTKRKLSTSINYAQIGYSYFNKSYYYIPLSKNGYMNNKYFKILYKDISNNYKYGSDFTYDNNTNNYTLSGTTQNTSSFNNINNTHYTCFNTTGTCSKISYIYSLESSKAYYIDLEDGKSVNDALNDMLYSDNVNSVDSNVKTYIDDWYKNNLLNKTNILEDTVYCYSRNVSSLGGWNPNGGDLTSILKFKNYELTTDLSCTNITDQFSVSNNKARLKYPVALISSEEMHNLGDYDANSLRMTSVAYWLLSPYNSGYNRRVGLGGNIANIGSNESNAVRPAITLKGNIGIISGDGSMTDPWVVD